MTVYHNLYLIISNTGSNGNIVFCTETIIKKIYEVRFNLQIFLKFWFDNHFNKINASSVSIWLMFPLPSLLPIHSVRLLAFTNSLHTRLTDTIFLETFLQDFLKIRKPSFQNFQKISNNQFPGATYVNHHQLLLFR